MKINTMKKFAVGMNALSLVMTLGVARTMAFDSGGAAKNTLETLSENLDTTAQVYDAQFQEGVPTVYGEQESTQQVPRPQFAEVGPTYTQKDVPAPSIWNVREAGRGGQKADKKSAESAFIFGLVIILLTLFSFTLPDSKPSSGK